MLTTVRDSQHNLDATLYVIGWAMFMSDVDQSE